MAKSKKIEAPAQEATPAEKFETYCRVELAGRVVTAPDLRYTPSGKAVSHLRVAHNDAREAHFEAVVAWTELAEWAAENLDKGSKVVVEGRLQTRSWEAADGSKRRATEIVASKIRAA